MHELYIVESILKSVCESLPVKAPPEAVLQVQMQVGKLDAVVPETLTFLFDAIKSSHRMPQAELLIEQIDIRCLCNDCGHEFAVDLPMFICPICGSGQVKVLRGRGIVLNRILIEDAEGADNGNTCRS